ncbi:MAG: hypothetical protein PHR35_02135 [Kiritimatiellae bacterium]|nr:hypothetical protein [Kiritimatiellia bacterium]
MGKVLRVLIFVVFGLGLVALILAGLNYSKREVLIERTHSLEEIFVKLTKTLEAEDPVEVARPEYPERDVSPITSREIENPELSAFWQTYQHQFEPAPQPIPRLDFDKEDKRLQLRKLYRIDPTTGKPAVSSLTGRPDTTGPDTMSELFEVALKRANAQYALLNRTRAELPKLRKELIDAIEELNNVKKGARADKKAVEERDVRIAQVENEKKEIEGKISRLEDEKRELNAELRESEEDKKKLNEQIVTMDDKIKLLEQKLGDFKLKSIPRQVAEAPDNNLENVLTPGEKGKVVSFNEQWKFVVVALDDAFMNEMLGADRSKALPQIEMMVRRPGLQGPAGDFVTRVRLRQVIQEHNLVVADILMDWQQAPTELGDVVYF